MEWFCSRSRNLAGGTKSLDSLHGSPSFLREREREREKYLYMLALVGSSGLEKVFGTHFHEFNKFMKLLQNCQHVEGEWFYSTTLEPLSHKDSGKYTD